MNMGFLAAIIAANAAAMKNQRERDEKNRKEKDMQDYKDEAPADMREVRHGKWIYTAFYGCNLATVKCSRCDYQCTTTKDIAVEICDFNYCSECGAKMDGEE